MRYIKNPKSANAPIKTVFEHEIYEIAPGDVLAFDESQDSLANFLLDTYGFLIEVDKKEVNSKNIDKFICPYCGRELKSRIGYISHVNACKKKHKGKKVIEQHIKSPKPKAVPHTLTDEEFNKSGIDMPFLSKAEPVKEKIGGRTEKMAYDGDGVGWYGPGIQDDFVPGFAANKKRGKIF